MSEMSQMSFSTFKVFITHLKVNEVFQNDGPKKAKIAFAVTKMFSISFLKPEYLLTKYTEQNVAKKTFLLNRYF